MLSRVRLLGLAALFLLPAACSKKEPNDGKVHIRYLANPDVGGFTKVIIERFEKENPGIVVEMVEGPSASDARENMYSTSFMAKEDTYDLVYMELPWLPKFAAQGWLRPLDDLFTPEARREYLAGDIAGSMYQGRIYRLPLQSDGGLLYYRKDLLAQKGIKPPRTWAELVAAAKATQTPDVAGFIFQGKQYEGLVCAYLEMMWGFGGELIDESGKVRVDEKPAVAALTALSDAIHKDKISPQAVLTYQEEETRNIFQEGKAVFMRNWPYAWNLMQDDKSPVKGKVGIIPMVAGPGGRSAATLGGWGYGITAFSKHPLEAWKFMEFFASAESQKTAYLQGGILPTRKSVFADKDILARSPQIKDLFQVLSVTHPRPPHPRWARVSDALQLHISAALAGQEQPGPALSAAAADIRAAVAP
ncbi:MAG: ABC transporter substrate-binding protein [Elusimicrobia bacterium]|nr:ABC transporter substrate-binding protein [Elusimicrobiota bacterium]